MTVRDLLDASKAGFDVNTNVAIYDGMAMMKKGTDWSIEKPIWSTYTDEDVYTLDDLYDYKIGYMTTDEKHAAIVIEIDI